MYHFSEPDFVSHAERLDEAAYAKVLDNIVVACVDVVVMCEDQILLGRRTQEPAKGMYWVMGGRMKPGETPHQTGCRILRRELALDVKLSRLFDLNTAISYAFARREQQPLNQGCHMLGLYFLLVITPKERDAITRTAEFSELRWIPARQISEEQSYHPAIRILAMLATRAVSNP